MEAGRMVIAVLLALVVLGVAIISIRSRSPRRSEFVAQFDRLGDLHGTTIDDIIVAVGEPTSRSLLPHGNVLAQWRAGSERLAILFDQDGRFLRMTHNDASTGH